VTSTSL